MELYDLFAHILQPPGPSLSDQVNECISILASSRWKAARLMNRFKISHYSVYIALLVWLAVLFRLIRRLMEHLFFLKSQPLAKRETI